MGVCTHVPLKIYRPVSGLIIVHLNTPWKQTDPGLRSTIPGHTNTIRSMGRDEVDVAVDVHDTTTQIDDPVACLFRAWVHIILSLKLKILWAGRSPQIMQLCCWSCRPCWLAHLVDSHSPWRHPYLDPCFRHPRRRLLQTSPPNFPKTTAAVIIPVTSIRLSPGCKQKEQKDQFLFHAVLL